MTILGALLDVEKGEEPYRVRDRALPVRLSGVPAARLSQIKGAWFVEIPIELAFLGANDARVVVGPRSRLLESLLRICNERDAEKMRGRALRFVIKHGPLLSNHKELVSSPPRSVDGERGRPCLLEPVAAYLAAAHRAYAILRASALLRTQGCFDVGDALLLLRWVPSFMSSPGTALQQQHGVPDEQILADAAGDLVEPGYVLTFNGDTRDRKSVSADVARARARDAVVEAINAWLAEAGAGAWATATGSALALDVGVRGPGVAGLVAWQVALKATNRPGIAVCFECGAIYDVDSPVTGRRSFCGKCGRRASWKAASAGLRERKRAKAKARL
jgi:hypothetical protein